MFYVSRFNWLRQIETYICRAFKLTEMSNLSTINITSFKTMISSNYLSTPSSSLTPLLNPNSLLCSHPFHLHVALLPLSNSSLLGCQSQMFDHTLFQFFLWSKRKQLKYYCNESLKVPTTHDSLVITTASSPILINAFKSPTHDSKLGGARHAFVASPTTTTSLQSSSQSGIHDITLH